MGIYGKLTRKRGLRFAVTNHSSHAWHWLQVAYDYDPEGPLAGLRYDAYTLTKADGKGKWWHGFDPQELYTGRNLVMPDGITSIAEANKFHAANDGHWHEELPAVNPEFARNWFLRCQDLVDSYQPDLLYFDDSELPLGQYGLDIAAHFYNASVRNKGHVDVVLTAKDIKPEHEGRIYSGHRARQGEQHSSATLADRHLHRRLALQRCFVRRPQIQDTKISDSRLDRHR